MVTRRIKFVLQALCGALILLNCSVAQAAKFTASVDRKELLLQEHAVLTLSLINSDTRLRAQGISPNVDLSVLTPDFDIGTPHVDNRYNIYRGQGRSTSELTVDLFPRRPGRLTIPAFTVDGLSTPAITITAHKLPPGTLPEIFSKSGVSTHSAWQRQQVVAWLDVYHRVKLKSASIGEYIDTEPMAIELMEHYDLPQSERKETVRGVGYDVTRIAWAIFPKDSGTLAIHLPDVWAVTEDGRKLRLPHRQQTVTVKALPAAVGADIAVGKPIVTQTQPKPEPTVNSVSTWTVTVRGPFSRFALPDTLPLAAMPDHVRVDSDHGQRNTETVTGGLTSVVSYTLSALPRQIGTFSLPPVRIPYFDPQRGTLAVTESAGAKLSVTSTAGTQATATQQPAPSENLPQSVGTDAHNASIWQIASVIFALLWLATSVMLWRRPRAVVDEIVKTPTVNHEPPPPTIHHPMQQRLLSAFGSRTLEQGLSAWEDRHGIDKQIRTTVRAVQQLCYGNSEETGSDALNQAVDKVVARIGNTVNHRDAINDPWRPESFTASPAHK